MVDLNLQHFSAIDETANPETYIAALEAFDGAEQLRELKALARDLGGLTTGKRVLDVGCGFGLETERLAKLVGADGAVSGIDKSARFIEEAKNRAAAAGLRIDYRTGDAQALPFDDASFDCVRTERVLCYLADPVRAVGEMRRVAKPGATLTAIEPEFATHNVNLPDRDLVRRVRAHEVATAAVTDWVPGLLFGLFPDLGLTDLRVATRVVLFPPDLGASYFSDAGRKAAAAGVIIEEELTAWLRDIATLHESGRLMASVGYFLFVATLPPSSGTAM
jgi:SAM-dependent methyltransferase